MTIQQAIKDAGEGGKIRHKSFGGSTHIVASTRERLALQFVGDMGCKTSLTISGALLLSDDWEVVESKPIVTHRKATMGDCKACDEPPNCGAKGDAYNIQLTPVHDAVKEAVELSKATTFNTSDIEPPVIEVRCDARSKFSGTGGKVLLVYKDSAYIDTGAKNLSILKLRDLTLIRKGPKVYEFGTVEIRDDRFMQINTKYPMPPNGNYLLTATEDA